MNDARRAAARSDDYHDYVFRDGKLVGDFDGMYRYSRDVPWRQDELADSWHAGVLLSMIRSRAPYASILEIGCGLGFFAEKLTAFGPVDACDISAEAIHRARQRTAAVRFSVADAASAEFAPVQRYGLVVLRDVLWYVCDRLDQVLTNVEASLAPGGLLALFQSFPALDSPYVGRDILSGPDTLMSKFSRFHPINSARLSDHDVPEDGPILVLLASRL